jgi:hypothetical protein
LIQSIVFSCEVHAVFSTQLPLLSLIDLVRNDSHQVTRLHKQPKQRANLDKGESDWQKLSRGRITNGQLNSAVANGHFFLGK